MNLPFIADLTAVGGIALTLLVISAIGAAIFAVVSRHSMTRARYIPLGVASVLTIAAVLGAFGPMFETDTHPTFQVAADCSPMTATPSGVSVARENSNCVVRYDAREYVGISPTLLTDSNFDPENPGNVPLSRVKGEWDGTSRDAALVFPTTFVYTSGSREIVGSYSGGLRFYLSPAR